MLKDFVRRALLFSIPIVLCACAFDVLLSRWLQRSPTHAQMEYPTWNAVLGGTVDAGLVVHGSSRAWVHFDPRVLEQGLGISTYNLGIDGHNIALQYARHQLLLKYNAKPRFIIHSLDIGTLQHQPELYNADQFLPYMPWNADIEEATRGYEGFTWYDHHLPLVRYFGRTDAIKAAVRMAVKPDSAGLGRAQGFRARNETWNQDFELAKRSMRYYEARLDTGMCALFNRYLTECANNGIAVVLVYSPEYIEGQEFVRNRSVVIDKYKAYSLAHGIPFFDLSQDPISYRKEYFYNATHMNAQGAELFTAKLVELLKPWVAHPPTAGAKK